MIEKNILSGQDGSSGDFTEKDAHPHLDPSDGHRAYTKWNLWVQYDLSVLIYSNYLVWRCPTHRLLSHFRRNASDNHLDAGVGTGFYLSRLPRRPNARIGLIDIDERCLARASRRAKVASVEVFQRNLLVPFAIDAPRFDSLSMMYLLHCLPGTMDEKAIVFDHVKVALRPGARIFGATILQGDVPVSPKAAALMTIYNTKGFFSNAQDSATALKRNLDARFCNVQMEQHGCVAVFSAENPPAID